MKKFVFPTFFLLMGFIFGYAVAPVDNDRPIFGSSGLPANCRAYVDYSVASYNLRRYTAQEIMVGLERNCGASGQLWKNN